MIQPIFHGIWLLANILFLLPLAYSRRLLMQTFLLLSFSFWAVFVKEFEGLGGGVAVKMVGELGDGGGDFKTEIEDFLLTLLHNFISILYARP